jgi:hypothetical protein
MNIVKHFQPLFSENKRLYKYNLPADRLRSNIEIVFKRSYGILQGQDIRGRFTGATTFQMDCPVPAFSYGVLRSTLYGVLYEQNGAAMVETRIHSAIALKIWFWLSMVLGLAGMVQVLITGHSILPPLALFLLGPLSAVTLASIYNAAIEDRYQRYIHKAITVAVDQERAADRP